jgi:acyl CoA:acetate/3-ketoacid CoA transferase
MDLPANAGGLSRPDLTISASDAAGLVPPGATVAVGGSGSLLQVAESVLRALGERFATSGRPSDLVVLHTMGLGDRAGRGIDHIARRGLVSRFIGSHFVLSPAEQRLIADNEVEAVGLPAGTISLLYREIAAGRPGLFTDIGLDTFVDPRQQWGCMNARTKRGLSEVVHLNDREWLHYPSFPIAVAILRATDADEHGNLSMDDEAAYSDNLAIAQAARNSGGVVIAEVKRVVAGGSIPAARVRVPGVLVDHVVITDHPNQTPITSEDPRRAGQLRNQLAVVEPMRLDHRKVIARRAAVELPDGGLINLGVGMANGISYVVLEEGLANRVTFTIEQGLFGGLPGIGLDSGTAINPAAIIDMSSQFDLYDGGALDFAGLGFGQIDREGNVDVARIGATPIGPGGFIDISQKARTVVFCGTFTGGGLTTEVSAGRLRITGEGGYRKFVERVDHVCFNARRAVAHGQRVRYVTERAVFALTADGVQIIEIAPGVDLDQDVLALLPFTPAISPMLTQMDEKIFELAPVRLSLGEPRPLRRFAVPSEELSA